MFEFSNKFAKIVRPAEVVADYTDLDGNLIRVKAKELLAQAICHELDHLDGQLLWIKLYQVLWSMWNQRKVNSKVFLGPDSKTPIIFE